MFLDFVAVFSECCNLGKVSNADDLVCRSDLFELAPDYTGCDPADAAVDLIEDHSRDLVIVTGYFFKSQHDP